MEVTTVSAHIRFSKEEKTGGWKTVELGCEANVGPEEDRCVGQSGLYAMLTQQLRALWSSNGHQNGSQSHPEGGWEAITVMPSPAKESPRPHWCSEHNTAFKRYEKDGRAWYSHRASNGWCKEPSHR
jgi:hypothetical protein